MENKPIKQFKRRLQGVVVSDKMNKTRVIVVERSRKHAIFHKYFKVTKRFKAHDEKNEYKFGDKVTIEETQPLSKEKRWKIINKI